MESAWGITEQVYQAKILIDNIETQISCSFLRFIHSKNWFLRTKQFTEIICLCSWIFMATQPRKMSSCMDLSILSSVNSTTNLEYFLKSSVIRQTCSDITHVLLKSLMKKETQLVPYFWGTYTFLFLLQLRLQMGHFMIIRHWKIIPLILMYGSWWENI